MDMMYEKIAMYQKNHQSIVVVTAVDKQGDGPVEVGKKMIVHPDGRSEGTVGGGALEHLAIERAKEIFHTKQPKHERYGLNGGKVIPNAETLPMVCGGIVTLYYEFVGIQQKVYIFGAGHVSQALVNVLKTLPFYIVVIDEREDVITRFEGAHQKICSNFSEFIKNENEILSSYVVVVTPSHRYDFEIIHHLLEKTYHGRYLGLLCSKAKMRKFLEDTEQRFGKNLDLSFLYAPIGLNLGGGTPEAIAVSIASELLAVSNEKDSHNHMRSKHPNTPKYWEVK